MKKLFQSGFFKIVGNKYVAATVFFLAWIIFFDENSIVSSIKNRKQLNELTQQKKYYKERIISDRAKLENLNKGKEELEKFAREQYHMSKPDEDVYIVVEEEK
jgi:cell division protein FtsB